MKEPKFSRRSILVITSSALLSAGSVAGWLRTHGYESMPERELRILSNWQFAVVTTLARRIAAPDDPDDKTIPSPDDVDVAGFVDSFVAEMHPLLRRDLLRLLGFIEHMAPLGKGFTSRFTKLSAANADSVLAWLESNDRGLLRGAFAAIKSLIFMGYYRDPRTWKISGYSGPFVNRPERGWF